MILGFSGVIVSIGFVYRIPHVVNYNCSSLLGLIYICILLFIGVLEAIMGRILICPSITSLPLNFNVILYGLGK